jgi:hypothetical protein
MSEQVKLPDKINYVAVEVIDKRSTTRDCVVVGGLFKGIVKKEDDSKKEHIYLLFEGPKGATDLYNLTFWNMMSVTVMGPEQKIMLFLTKDEDDQKDALDILEKVINVFVEEKRMLKNDPGIIDITTYKNIPTTGFGKKVIKDGRTEETTSYGVGGSKSTTSSTGTSTPAYGYQKKEPKPFFFERTKGKKPDKTQLEDLIQKLDEIKAGSFEAQIPPLEKEEEPKEAAAGGAEEK